MNNNTSMYACMEHGNGTPLIRRSSRAIYDCCTSSKVDRSIQLTVSISIWLLSIWFLVWSGPSRCVSMRIWPPKRQHCETLDPMKSPRQQATTQYVVLELLLLTYGSQDWYQLMDGCQGAVNCCHSQQPSQSVSPLKQAVARIFE